jgi:hypothetical protein
MEYLYCPNCGRMTGHKRALGWGTFFGAALTFGASTTAIPFYPKRCIVCGRKSSDKDSKPRYSESHETSESEPQSGTESREGTMKKCPACAELIKLEAIKCRFCGEKFDQADVARQVAKARNEDSFENRVLCNDGSCIGVIGLDRRCKVCGKPYEPDLC